MWKIHLPDSSRLIPHLEDILITPLSHKWYFNGNYSESVEFSEAYLKNVEIFWTVSLKSFWLFFLYTSNVFPLECSEIISGSFLEHFKTCLYYLMDRLERVLNFFSENFSGGIHEKTILRTILRIMNIHEI